MLHERGTVAMADRELRSVAAVAEAVMRAANVAGSSLYPEDAESVVGTPRQYRRRYVQADGDGDGDGMGLRPRSSSGSKARQRRMDYSTNRALSKQDSKLVLQVPAMRHAGDATAAGPATISTAGGGRRRKVNYKRNVSYPIHDADEDPGGESGNESDEEDDDEFWKEVREKSKGMMMYKAAKQTTRLERKYKKFNNSWDKVLLDVVENEADGHDGRDMKFSLNLLLRTHSASVDVTDGCGDTPLHCAARGGKLEAVEMLLQAGAKTTACNLSRKTPLLLALSEGHDEAAARIMASMQPARVRDVFIAHGDKPCAYSFHDLIKNPEMKDSLTAALDSMIKKTHDEPNNFKFFLQILDGDEQGRCPRDPLFSHHRTALQLIAKIGNKTAVYHNVVRILLWHKWKQFVSKKYWMQAGVFALYIVVMTVALMFAADAPDPTKYTSSKDYFRAVCEVLSVLFCVYGLAAECNQLRKQGSDYFEDLYNYVDVASFTLLLAVIPLRFTHSSAQWTVASFGYLATCLRFFKYTCALRNIGAYTQILGRIVQIDIVRFMIIFCIFLITFSGSFFLALRGQESYSTELNRTITDLDLVYHARSYPEILLTGLRIMIESGPIIGYYEENVKLGWLAIVLILLFMFVVIVVLLNILIAQLTDSYQNVQSDAQREVELNRAYIVGHVEKNSLLYKNLLADHYKPYITVCDPVNVLERWECPPLNDLHRQLHRISNRLGHYDSALLTMEHTQSCQTEVLESLKEICTHQSSLIERLLRKLKKQKKKAKRRQQHGDDRHPGDVLSSSSSSDDDDNDGDKRKPAESEGIEDDELGGVRKPDGTTSPQPHLASLNDTVLHPSVLATLSGTPDFARHLHRRSAPVPRAPSYHEMISRSSPLGTPRTDDPQHRHRSFSAGAAANLKPRSTQHHHPPARPDRRHTKSSTPDIVEHVHVEAEPRTSEYGIALRTADRSEPLFEVHSPSPYPAEETSVV